MRAKLPAELVELLTSPEFAERCIANFESLDTDGSGKLEGAVLEHFRPQIILRKILTHSRGWLLATPRIVLTHALL